MFLTMFEKIQNIMLTMHINDVYQMIKKYRKISYVFSNTNYRVNIQNLNSIFEAWKKLSRVTFLAE